MPRFESEGRGRALTAVAIETPAGKFTAGFSERGLAQLDFPRRYTQPPLADPAGFSPQLRAWIALTQQAANAVLKGEVPAEIPPLDLSAGTKFQQRVWSALRGIRMGQTKSYGQIATEIGSPKAVRAVGGACGANPIPLLIPCHRVLAANVALGGFSGGLDWKLRLLAAEGITSAGWE
jgi:methylated-DNA-[protein]-cysteine S-methyltransferase